MKTLICPNCSTQIPLEEAVTHQIREELQRQFQAAAARREQALSNRELKLAGMQAHLDKRAESLDEEIEQRLQAEADQIRANAKKQVESAFEIQLRDLRAEVSEKERKLGEATKFELELRKKQRDLESRQQALTLEVARRVDQELEKVRQEATRAAAEEQQLRLSEKEKLISELESEKRAFAKIWARREKQIGQVIVNTTLMYGGIQGIVGRATLPEIACLQLPEGDGLSTTGE